MSTIPSSNAVVRYVLQTSFIFRLYVLMHEKISSFSMTLHGQLTALMILSAVPESLSDS